MTEDGVNEATLREKLKDVVRHAKTGNALSFRIDSAYAQAIIWASERIAELETQKQSPETGGDEVRGLFFRLGYACETTAATYCEAVLWGQDRIRYLERHHQELLVDIKKLELELENEKSAYKRLEQENEQLELELENENLKNLKVAKTDEEIHQRRRRERLLDEVTLLCVRHDIKHKNDDSTWSEWGNWSRMDALEILSGIESVKNEQ